MIEHIPTVGSLLFLCKCRKVNTQTGEKPSDSGNMADEEDENLSSVL